MDKGNQLKHLVEQDRALFKLKGPFGGKPRSLSADMRVATDSNQDPFFHYRESENNDLCMSDLCMSDIDNYLCHGATTLLIKTLGDKAAMDFIYQTMNAISLHYRSISVPKIINLDFLVGYMSTQAFAIPTIWHAKRMKMITTKSKRDDLYIYRAMADVKYRAFALGLIPVGTRVENGIAKLVVWKGSKS